MKFPKILIGIKLVIFLSSIMLLSILDWIALASKASPAAREISMTFLPKAPPIPQLLFLLLHYPRTRRFSSLLQTYLAQVVTKIYSERETQFCKAV